MGLESLIPAHFEGPVTCHMLLSALFSSGMRRAKEPRTHRLSCLGRGGGPGTQARDDHRYSVCSTHVLSEGAAPPETAARPHARTGAPGSPGVGDAVE